MSGDDSLELFSRPQTSGVNRRAPLADRMRPTHFDEMEGQEKLVGKGAPLRRLIEANELPSLILWGPPGSGKTTLARLLSELPDTDFALLSAVAAGVKEIRAVAEKALRPGRASRRSLLFLDEIHRLNRAQQDVLLPHVEKGTLTLVGATTENPSFEVNAPLLSRCRVFTLLPLDEAALERVVRRALSEPERGLGKLEVSLHPEAARAIVHASDGDARRALGLLEDAVALHRQAADPQAPLPPETVREAAGRRVLVHDRDREEHYNVVSALIKSLRASDPDAALYYLVRMLDAGEDPLFVARRLVILAAEDIGNADPQALTLATSAFLAVERIGMPEGRIPLAQAVTYLACAPKSNASFAALSRAQAALEESGTPPVPLHLRNAPTALMRAQGYGRDYRNPHQEPEGFVADPNLPEILRGRRFYHPSKQGEEAKLASKLTEMQTRREK